MFFIPAINNGQHEEEGEGPGKRAGASEEREDGRNTSGVRARSPEASGAAEASRMAEAQTQILFFLPARFAAHICGHLHTRVTAFPAVPVGNDDHILDYRDVDCGFVAHLHLSVRGEVAGIARGAH